MDFEMDSTEEVKVKQSAILLSPGDHDDMESHVGDIVYIVDESDDKYKIVLNWHSPSVWVEKALARPVQCADAEFGGCSSDNELIKCFLYNPDIEGEEVFPLCYEHAKGDYCFGCGNFYGGSGQLDFKDFCDNCHSEFIDESWDEDYDEDFYF